MTPQEERNRKLKSDIEEKFGRKNDYGISIFREGASIESVVEYCLSHLTSEVNLTIEQVEKWAGENKYADGCTGTGEDCGSKKYNQALDDLLSFLTTLKK